MAIALSEVADSSLVTRAVALALVGILITAGVYGAVALIVKMDDIGLHLAKKDGKGTQAFGRMLVSAMPKVLTVLASVGTLAMLWVGGGIVLHGLEELGVPAPAHIAHAFQHWLEVLGGPLGGALGWLGYAVASAVVGLVLGAVIAVLVHLVATARGSKAH
jgi:predicted DNA repair protein MutK